jgi:hypothetical protein
VLVLVCLRIVQVESAKNKEVMAKQLQALAANPFVRYCLLTGCSSTLQLSSISAFKGSFLPYV